MFSAYLKRSVSKRCTSFHHHIQNRSKHVLVSSSLQLNGGNYNTFQFSNNKLYDLQQQRHMGRRDGNKAFYETRPPTRKQTKTYYKRKREEHEYNISRHSKPGSKAGPRREYIQDEFQHLVDSARGLVPLKDERLVDYDYGNALVDDLIGNSSHLSSTPTPKPLYIANQYIKHFERITKMMNDYRHYLKIEESGMDTNDPKSLEIIPPPLPTDSQISLLIRSYRDRHSTKTQKLGIANALRHLITDAKLPTKLFGEKTYSSLMLCASTPNEARRVMKMMQENKITVDSYIYSILVDIHAKAGDFRGADNVLNEMRYEGIEPTLPAYTSMLAACYKLVNNVTTPRAIKSEAAELAWNRWKELKIIGLQPDVLCYGAIIRIMAARGLPEQAINLIEDMHMNEIKPTTLIFTSALKAVARSHSNALRFEGGKSKKHKRRELITAHHGKMARQLVIMAEQSQVVQDDGYISALMNCASVAGDAATTKAIYIANEVQKLEQLRTIGDRDHLLQLRGNISRSQSSEFQNALVIDEKESFIPENSESTRTALLSLDCQPSAPPRSMYYHDQTLKKDTRTLTALLQANANALSSNGMGTLWAGKQNKGYLCENSLRFIQQRDLPKYMDKSIPGIDGSSSGLNSVVWDDEEDKIIGKRLKKKKFMGVLHDTEENRIDELDPMLYRLFVENKDDLFDTDDNSKDDDDSYQDSFHFQDGKLISEPEQQEKNRHSSDLEKSHEIQILIDEMNLDDVDFYKRDGKLCSDPSGNIHAHADAIEVINHLDEAFSNRDNNTVDNVTPSIHGVQSHSELQVKDDLDIVLLGLPQSRIQKVRDEFKRNLGKPSMLRLVPLLRENIPDDITRDWLLQKNIRDARTVFDKASADGVLNDHMKQSMLQVYAKGKNIKAAVDFLKEYIEVCL